MTSPNNTGRKCQNLVTDDDVWLDVLGPFLCKDPSTAHCLAYLLFKIKQDIEGGSDGIKRASATLLNVIRLIYLYTDTHQAALKLYQLSLSGHLTPQNDPLRVINEAIERARAEVERGIADEGKR